MGTEYNLLPAPVEHEGTEGSVYDLENPRAIINLVTKTLKEAMLRIPKEIHAYSESQLNRYAKPTSTIGRLRLSFWDEYGLAQDQGRPIKIQNVIRNISSLEYWDATVLKNEKFIAYIMCPPKDYMVTMRNMHRKAMKRLEEVLDLPIMQKRSTSKGGMYEVPNTMLIAQIIRITQLLEERVMGAVVQKSLNLNISQEKEVGDIQSLTIEEIDKKLAEIKRHLGESARDKGGGVGTTLLEEADFVEVTSDKEPTGA